MAKPQFSSEPVDVGNGFVVEFRFTPAGIICEWTPDVPRPDQMKVIAERYRAAMACFVSARLTRTLGECGPVTTVLREGGAHG